jgi:hypothetical protein
MRRAVTPLAVSFALALVPAARADEAAALYDPAAVARIDLTLSPEAIAALTADPSTYVPATFAMQLGGETFAPRPAELKLKGHGTFRRARRGERLRVSGVLRLPAGARCGGRVAVRVDVGGTMLALREVFVRRDCRYAARFRVPRRAAVTVHARFLGTSRLAPRSAAPRMLRPRARARSASRGGS